MPVQESGSWRDQVASWSAVRPGPGRAPRRRTQVRSRKSALLSASGDRPSNTEDHMSTVAVRYRATPEQAAENQRLVEEVFRELDASRPDGLRHAAYRLADGTSFCTSPRSPPLPTRSSGSPPSPDSRRASATGVRRATGRILSRHPWSVRTASSPRIRVRRERSSTLRSRRTRRRVSCPAPPSPCSGWSGPGRTGRRGAPAGRACPGSGSGASGPHPAHRRGGPRRW